MSSFWIEFEIILSNFEFFLFFFFGMLKIVVFGCGMVGKSAFVIQFIQNHFIDCCDPNIDDTYRKTYFFEGRNYDLAITDTSGIDELTAMNDVYMRDGDGFIFLYSVTSRVSFDGIAQFYERVVALKNRVSIPMVVVGNMIDIYTKRQVLFEEGEEIAKAMNCPFIEVSSKERTNVDFVFDSIIRAIDAEKVNDIQQANQVPKKSKFLKIFKNR